MAMVKVVLIDDEDVIIDGLKVLIDWEPLGFEVVGEAYDGEAAVTLIEAVLPDIIITDIRMPVLNGLEMIDRIKRILPQVAIIILSGFSDFDYARQALDKGASCYLLKPVTRAELIEKLGVIKDQIEREKRRIEDLENLRGAAKQKYLKDLVDGKIVADQQVWQIWDLFQFGNLPRSTCAVLFELDDFNGLEAEQPGEKPALKSAVDHIIEELCIKTNAGLFFSYNDERSVLVACSPKSGVLKKATADFIKEVKRAVAENLKITLSVGIGSAYDSAGRLALSFNEALQALEFKFVYGGNITVDIENVDKAREKNEFKPNPLVGELISEIEACDKEGTHRLLERLFRYMLHTSGATPNQVYAECLNICALLRQSVPEEIAEKSGLYNEEMYQVGYLKRFKTQQELQQWLLELAFGLIDRVKNQPVSTSEQLVAKIKKYIAENFAEVTRETVAANFYINPSYLSQIFKQMTGSSFTDYLTDIRVKQAKKLLVHTDLKIQTIAEKIGYSSSQHFSKVFEKYVDMSPFDYRKQHGK